MCCLNVLLTEGFSAADDLPVVVLLGKVDCDTFTQQFSNNSGEKCAPIVPQTRSPSSLFSRSPLARGVNAVPIGCRAGDGWVRCVCLRKS